MYRYLYLHALFLSDHDVVYVFVLLQDALSEDSASQSEESIQRRHSGCQSQEKHQSPKVNNPTPSRMHQTRGGPSRRCCCQAANA